jgi:xanthine/uracil/vitamin C permease (AzgA family)
MFILFILYADIVGSPYHMAYTELSEKHGSKFDGPTEDQIGRSFHVDSVANIVAPIVGTSPVVYYAENFAGRVLGGRGPWVAYVPAILFLALGVFGYAFATDNGIHSLVPGVAVAPVLFVVGVIIISKALTLETPIPEKAPSPGAAAAGAPGWSDEFLRLGFRLPAAIAIVLTPIVDFATGIACGILSYTVFSALIPRELAKAYDDDVSGEALLVFFVIASIALFFKFAV